MALGVGMVIEVVAEVEHPKALLLAGLLAVPLAVLLVVDASRPSEAAEYTESSFADIWYTEPVHHTPSLILHNLDTHAGRESGSWQ